MHCVRIGLTDMIHTSSFNLRGLHFGSQMLFVPQTPFAKHSTSDQLLRETLQSVTTVCASVHFNFFSGTGVELHNVYLWYYTHFQHYWMTNFSPCLVDQMHVSVKLYCLYAIDNEAV